jgi:hypothetical protein
LTFILTNIFHSTGILGDENQLTRSASQTDDNIKHEEKPLHGTDEKTTKGIDHPERQRSIHTAEPFSSEELEISVETKPNELQSSSVALTTSSTSQEERKQSLSQSDNILHPTNVREEINSSLTNKTEENSPTGTVSSSTTHDNKANLLSGQDTTKQLSHSTSLTDIKGNEIKFEFVEHSFIRLFQKLIHQLLENLNQNPMMIMMMMIQN